MSASFRNNRSNDAKLKPSVRLGFGRGRMHWIDSAYIPIAGYIDKYSVITKNGEIMQTIAITCHDNGANLCGALRLAIQKAIVLATPSDEGMEYSFWIHTVKTEVLDFNARKECASNHFCDAVMLRWNDLMKNCSIYNTITYITIVRSGMDLSMKPSNLIFYTNKSLLYRAHNIFLKKGVMRLNNFSDKIISQLSNWNARKLSIVKRNDVYYTEHLEFLDHFVNFSSEKYRVPIADLSRTLNRSAYSFNFDFGIARRGGVDDDKRRYFAIFAIKDCHSLAADAFARLISELKSVTFCEISHFEKASAATNEYKKQYDALQVSGDVELGKILELDQFFSIEKNAMVCRRATMVMVDAASKAELEICTAELTKKVADVGLILTAEDIGLERTFYAFIPGNFSFIQHSGFVTMNDVGAFIYAYSFGDEDVNNFIDKSYLCMLPMMRGNLYMFGLHASNPNILILGDRASDKTTLTNFLLSCLMTMNPGVYIMESGDGSKNFIDAIDGKNYYLSLQKDLNTCTFNPMQDADKSFGYSTFLLDILNLLAAAEKITMNDNDNSFASHAIMDIITDNNVSNFGNFVKKFIGTSLEHALMHWHGIGNKAHILDNGRDVLLEDVARKIVITFAPEVIGNGSISIVLAYCALYRIITTMQQGINVIVINDFFTLFPARYIQYLSFLMKLGRDRGAIFIITSRSMRDLENWALSSEYILPNFSTQFHICNNALNDRYAELFSISKGDMYMLQSLSGHQYASLLKQNDAAIPILPDFNRFSDNVLGILSDSNDIRSYIKSAKAVHGQNWLNNILS